MFGMILAMAANSALAGSFTLNPFAIFAPKEATTFATKMTAGIEDRPECKKFKDEIMSHAKESGTNANTGYLIGLIRNKARSAGCIK